MALFGREEPHQRETYSRSRPFVSGETVTPGRFRCVDCDYELKVPTETITNLPVCPRCQAEEWNPA
jgi:uncharacterized paraquat-inducible protein A